MEKEMMLINVTKYMQIEHTDSDIQEESMLTDEENDKIP